MDTQKLKYFIEVAECRNFSEAAFRTGVTQSAISQQIAELEKQVGTKLIIRKKRPLQLTSAGKVLLREVYPHIAKIDEAINKAYLASKGITGFLKVGFLGGIERRFLPQGIREFRENYPDIELTFYQYSWDKLNKALVNGDIDVGFSMSYCFEQFSELESSELFHQVNSIAMHRNHHLAAEKILKMSSLKKEPFVTLSPEADYLIYSQTIKLCEESGFHPHIVSMCSNMDAVVFLVEAGLGVSLLPGTVQDLAGRNVRFVEIDSPNKYFEVLIAWNKNCLNPSIPLFVEKFKSLKVIKALDVI